MIKKCSHCDKELPENAKFCGYCGAGIAIDSVNNSSKTPESPTEKPKNNTGIWWSLGIIGFLLFIFHSYHPNATQTQQTVTTQLQQSDKAEPETNGGGNTHFTLLPPSVPSVYGWVNDFANVIDKVNADKLSSLIKEVEQKTASDIAVVTIDSIAPYDEKEYARLLFDNFKFGKREKENGVLVLLAVKERRWRIETGYGMENILSDDFCAEVGREYMVPYFKNDNYGEGLYYGVVALAKRIAENAHFELMSIKDLKLK